MCGSSRNTATSCSSQRRRCSQTLSGRASQLCPKRECRSLRWAVFMTCHRPRSYLFQGAGSIRCVHCRTRAPPLVGHDRWQRQICCLFLGRIGRSSGGRRATTGSSSLGLSGPSTRGRISARPSSSSVSLNVRTFVGLFVSSATREVLQGPAKWRHQIALPHTQELPWACTKKRSPVITNNPMVGWPCPTRRHAIPEHTARTQDSASDQVRQPWKFLQVFGSGHRACRTLGTCPSKH